MPVTLKPVPCYSTRWWLEVHAPTIARIDRDCGGDWTREAVVAAYAPHRNRVGLVAESGGEVGGFVLYELRGESLRLLRFGAPAAEASSALLHKLADKAAFHRRRRLDVAFREAVRMREARLGPDSGGSGRLEIRLLDLPVIRPAWLSDSVRWMCAGPCPHLPILADALEEAGCENADLLALFRADGDAAWLVFEGLRERLVG